MESQFTEEHLLDAKEVLSERYAKSSLEGRLCRFKAIFTYAVEKGYIQDNPMAWFSGTTPEKAEKTYIPEQRVEDLIKLVPDEWKRLLFLFHHSF